VQNRWLYIYDLPTAYNTELLATCPAARLAHQARALGALGRSEEEEGFEMEPGESPICKEAQTRGSGRAVTMGTPAGGLPWALGAGGTPRGELALEQYFFQRLLSHECRTCECQKASLFFLLGQMPLSVTLTGYRNSHSDSQSDSHSDSHSDSYSDSHSDSYSDSHSHSDSYSDCDHARAL